MPDYDSPFFITNDRTYIDQDAIEDGSAVVWPLSDDAKLVRSPDRQYCGNYVTYGDKSAATYRHNDDTHDLIAAGPNQHRDMVSSFPLVKTLTKAQARGDRQLLDVQDQDVRITTRLENVPITRATLAKAGMRLQIKGTHWGPTCDDWHYARIVTAEPQPHGAGELCDISLELVMGMPVESSLSPGPLPPPFAGAMFAGLQRSRGDSIDQRGPLKFASTYDIGGGGWYTRTTTGPLAIVPGVTNPEADGLVYYAIQVSEAAVVRIHARAGITGVYIPDTTATMNVRVNGSLIGTQTALLSGPAAGTTLDIDIHDYLLAADDIVSVDSAGSGLSDTIFWTNSGVNDTYLHVARGTIYDNGGTNLITVGP